MKIALLVIAMLSFLYGAYKWIANGDVFGFAFVGWSIAMVWLYFQIQLSDNANKKSDIDNKSDEGVK